MADPISMAILGFGAQAAGSALGGLLAPKPKESKTQKQRRALVDDLLASLKGEGSYNDLFQTDDAAFQKSVVDPAKQRFQGQIAPQIQQEFISSGMQRGTGLDDALARSGVEMDQLLNQQFIDFQQQGQNRQYNAIGSILGSQDQGFNPQSSGDQARAGLGGFLSGDAFQTGIKNIGESFYKDPTVTSSGTASSLGGQSASSLGGQSVTPQVVKKQRKGFEMPGRGGF